MNPPSSTLPAPVERVPPSLSCSQQVRPRSSSKTSSMIFHNASSIGGQDVIEPLELGLELSRVLPRFAGPILQGLDLRLDIADGVGAQLQRKHGNLKPAELHFGRALFEKRDHLT